jgi:hypothetical protein
MRVLVAWGGGGGKLIRVNRGVRSRGKIGAMLKRLALGLLTAWAAFGFLHEVNEAVAGWDGRALKAAGPWAWRMHTPAIDGLARCLREARGTMPAGNALAVASSDDAPEAQFRRWRWAAYFLPEYDVLQVSDPSAALVVQYVVAYRTEIHDPRIEPVRRLPGGWLYRVKRP